jgi:hypothetical protein
LAIRPRPIHLSDAPASRPREQLILFHTFITLGRTGRGRLAASVATAEARIANRLRNSGGEEAEHIVQKGSGPTRTITNIHNRARQHGAGNPGEGDILGNKRGVV